jgi:hypothetical protein
MKLKDSSVKADFHPMITKLLFHIAPVYTKLGGELTITSGSEHTAKHGVNSLHYAIPACAFDVRTWTIGLADAKAQHTLLVTAAKEFCKLEGIPTGWVEVIFESDHIHVEFQPKRTV